MANCFAPCGGGGGIAPDVLSAMNARMRGVKDFFPGTNICCILNPQGEVLAEYHLSPVKQCEVQAVIGALKQAAVQFGEVVGQLDCPVIHIKGAAHVFSCYDLGGTGNLLAFYSELHGTSVEIFDTARADDAMADTVAELSDLLSASAP